jgi:hypothetical protein
MSSPGRPRVLDDVKRGQIVAIVGAGCGLAAAARFVGCSADTVRREAVRNHEFRQALRSAEVRGQMEPLKALRQAAITHWRAAAWLLERANPRQFDRRRTPASKPAELVEVVEAVVETAVDEIADAETRTRVCRRLLAAARQAVRGLTVAHDMRLAPKSFNPLTSADEAALHRLIDGIEKRARKSLTGGRP